MKKTVLCLTLIILFLAGCTAEDILLPGPAPDLSAGQPDTVILESAAGSAPPPESSPESLFGLTSAPAAESPEPEQTSGMTVHFIDVGQGDSTLIVCDGEAMLIDAGDNDKGTAVQLYLIKQQIGSLKYVIGTHPDADHIGGLDVILYKFDCETIIMPDRESDSASCRDVMDTMAAKGYRNTLPWPGDTYALGSASFTVVSLSKQYDKDNDCSVALMLRHGDNTFLFTGDAESRAENDIVNSEADIGADVYKTGHHGSKTSSGAALLEAVSPEYAVISCGADNPYGFPHAETLNRLRAMGVRVFRTDEQGTVTVFSDGSTLSWSCSPSETWQAGELPENSPFTEEIPSAALEAPSESAATASPEAGSPQSPALTYILNTNTGKFHKPECPSVQQMAEKNKLRSNASREEILQCGYEPCGRCRP